MDKVRWDEIRWWNGKSIWQWRLHNSISFDLLPRPRRKSTAKRTARCSSIRNLISSTMNARTLMRMETKQRLRWRSHFTQLLHIWQFISIFADASDGSTKAETSQKRETCSRRWFLSKDQEDEMFVYGYKKSTTHKQCSLEEAEKVLVKEKFLSTTGISFIRRKLSTWVL